MIPEAVLGKDRDEAWYRVIAPAYAGTPLSGMGAARRGGRFNRPGQEALYLSNDEATSLAEYKQDNPWLPPGTICTFFVHGLRVANLAGGFDPGCWPALWADFEVDWRAEWFDKGIEPPTWYMADLPTHCSRWASAGNEGRPSGTWPLNVGDVAPTYVSPVGRPHAADGFFSTSGTWPRPTDVGDVAPTYGSDTAGTIPSLRARRAKPRSSKVAMPEQSA